MTDDYWGAPEAPNLPSFAVREWGAWRADITRQVQDLRAAVVGGHAQVREDIAQLRGQLLADRRTLVLAATIGGGVAGVVMTLVVMGLRP